MEGLEFELFALGPRRAVSHTSDAEPCLLQDVRTGTIIQRPKQRLRQEAVGLPVRREVAQGCGEAGRGESHPFRRRFDAARPWAILVCLQDVASAQMAHKPTDAEEGAGSRRHQTWRRDDPVSSYLGSAELPGQDPLLPGERSRGCWSPVRRAPIWGRRSPATVQLRLYSAVQLRSTPIARERSRRSIS